MIRPTLLLASLLLSATLLQASDTRYITDDFEITVRSGTSTTNSIVRLLRSGEPVTLLEQNLTTQYSLVETDDGQKGYVLSRFLVETPAARHSLQELRTRHEQQQARVEEQAAQIAELEKSLQQERSDNETLKTTLRASEQELAGVLITAENTLDILDQNKQLQTQVERLHREKSELSETNASLSDSTQIDWFVRGGAVSLIAFVIGILVTRIRWRKQDSWGSY